MVRLITARQRMYNMWLDVTGKGLQRQTIVSKEKVWIQF